MSQFTDSLLSVGALLMTSFVVAYGVREGWATATKWFGAEYTPASASLKEQGVAQNDGIIQRVATERGIMNGQAVGQTVNLSNDTPYGKIMYGPDLSNYAMTLATTLPEFGQNYSGSAVGTNWIFM